MSMAYHHQYYLCHQLLLNHGQIASNYLYSGDTHLLDARSFEVPVGLEEAMDELTFGGDVSFSLAIHVDRHGIRFAVGNVVCTTYKEDDFPLFAFIMHILIFDENVVFIVQKAITDNFDNDYLSYKIRKVDDVCITSLDELTHGIPLFPQIISGDIFVKLRNSRVVEFLELN